MTASAATIIRVDGSACARARNNRNSCYSKIDSSRLSARCLPGCAVRKRRPEPQQRVARGSRKPQLSQLCQPLTSCALLRAALEQMRNRRHGIVSPSKRHAVDRQVPSLRHTPNHSCNSTLFAPGSSSHRQGHIPGLCPRGDMSMRRDRHTAPIPLSAREDRQQYVA